MVPLRRLGTVDDIGAVCAFLASDDAAWLTGETIQVTGGSRIPVGYMTYMYNISRQLEAARSGASSVDPEEVAVVDT
jgi:hypothetical protein